MVKVIVFGVGPLESESWFCRFAYHVDLNKPFSPHAVLLVIATVSRAVSRINRAVLEKCPARGRGVQ